ncbi:MAG: hypothetical protein WKF81_06320, partial [Thermomicrobiales bacterium]
TTAIAQESTPGMAGMTDYPVAIHEGTCDSPVSQPAWDIDNTVPYGQGDDAEVLGTTSIAPVLETSATIDANLDTLGNNEYVVVVHASPNDFDSIVACGDIAGMKSDGRLVFALVPTTDSEVSGIAILNEDSEGILGLGDDQIQVTVYLMSENTEQ